MLIQSTLLYTAAGLLHSISAVAAATPSAVAVDSKTFEARGVSLGGWLLQESTIITTWWATNSGNAVDAWTCCANLDSQCGPGLTSRYATWINTTGIDTLAAAKFNLFRIPTTYAAWVKVAGSPVNSGDQASYFDNIASYAIIKDDTHIILAIHSSPGGVNGMLFGERQGGFDGFTNATVLDHSYRTVSALIEFIQKSPRHAEAVVFARGEGGMD